jgi:glycosyltransferase involved in cell wall biosynthesis
MFSAERPGSNRTGGRIVRILHIHSGNLYGGVETFLSTLARYGAQSPSVTTDFALCFDARLRRELIKAGATAHRVGEVHVRSPWSVRAARDMLARTLTEGRYDVVVNHSAWSHGIFAPVAREYGKRLVYYMHDLPRRFGWVYRWADRTTPDLVLCNSEFVARSASWFFRASPRRVARLPLAVERNRDESARARIREALGASDDAVVILHASRMQSLKGHRLLIDALARVRSRARWVCWFAGGAQRTEEVRYLDTLKEAARRNGLLDRITFLGERQDVGDLMSAADIYCQPNTEPESFGLSFVEALASGSPVVTTRMGGATEIVTSSCGVLVPPQTRPLADALARLVDDREMRLGLASNGPGRARELCGTQERVAELAAHMIRLVPSVSPADKAQAP